MYVLEHFYEETFIDSAFAFDNLELETKKRELISKAQKGDTIYISTMNDVYDKDIIIKKITKIT